MKIIDLNNENDLLIKIANGDQQAFRVIFDFYRNKVFSYSIKILRSENAAQEVVQDVFLKIWVNRENLSEIQNLGGYLRTLTRNQALTALRKIARETLAFSEKNQDWQDVDLQTENYINYKDIKELLNRALNTLPQQQELVYKLCKIDGMKNIEVAQQLNISVQTVKSHLKMASQTIRSFIYLHNNHILLLIFLLVNQVFISACLNFLSWK